jgi:hypothetical protein
VAFHIEAAVVVAVSSQMLPKWYNAAAEVQRAFDVVAVSVV